jgi:hypothetical protein
VNDYPSWGSIGYDGLDDDPHEGGMLERVWRRLTRLLVGR